MLPERRRSECIIRNTLPPHRKQSNPQTTAASVVFQRGKLIFVFAKKNPQIIKSEIKTMHELDIYRSEIITDTFKSLVMF